MRGIPHFLFLVIALELYDAPAAAAQHHLTTFGAAAEWKIARNTGGIASGDFNGDGRPDLATFGGTQIRFFIADSSDNAWPAGAPLILRHRITAVRAARINADALTDLVVLTDDPPAVAVYLARPSGAWLLAWEGEIPGAVDGVAVADLNGDRRPDILLYGRKQLGVTVFTGSGHGTFARAVTILPDYSFAALLVADLHGRGIPDLVGSNWITNEISVFAGFGKMKFGEPSTIGCPAEPAWLAAASLDSASRPGFAAGFTAAPSVVTYTGDGLGAFTADQTIQLPDPPAGLESADVNGDGRDDLIIPANGRSGAGPGSLIVLLNGGHGRLEESVTFAAGRHADAMCLLRRPGGTDAVVIDTAAGRLRLLAGTPDAAPAQGQAAAVRWPSDATIATGLGPAAVLAARLGGGAVDEVIVANAASNSLSIFLQDGAGNYGGQISCQLPGTPRTMAALRRSDSTATMVVASDGSMYVVDLALPLYSHEVATLPTEGRARILRLGLDGGGQFLRITAYEPEGGRPSVVEYEQIAANRYVERTIPVQSAAPLRALTMADVNGDGIADLVYASANRQHHSADLVEALGTPQGRFAAPRTFASIPGGDTTTIRLWPADLNGDRKDDLVVGLGPPAGTLSVYLADSLPVPAGIAFPGIVGADERLSVTDANGDGLTDLVLFNDETKSLDLRAGRGDGGFNPPARLAEAEGLGGFAIASGPGGKRLVMSDSLNGFLRIIALGR